MRGGYLRPLLRRCMMGRSAGVMDLFIVLCLCVSSNHNVTNQVGG